MKLKCLKYQKWIMLFLYSFLQFIGGSIWVTFASIIERAESYYSVSSDIINLFSLSFLIMQFPMAPLSSYLYRRSYYWTTMIAYLVTVIGVWVRVIAERNVVVCLLGQTMVGAMNSLTLPGCSMLAGLWFEESLQPIAVAIASSASLIGAAYGLVIGPYYPSIELLLITQGIYASVGGFLNLILSDTKKSTLTEESNFRLEAKILSKDKYTVALIVLISAGIGVAYAITGIIFQLLQPFGISEVQSGWIGFSMYVGGTIGGLTGSYLIKHSKDFILPIRIFAGFSIVGIMLWAALAEFFPADVVMSGIAGLGLYGLVPLGIQAIIDQNPHVPESITTTLIYLMAQGISVVFTYPMIYFYAITGISGMWLATIFTFLSYFILLISYRMKYIEKYKEKNESTVTSLKSVLNEAVN